LPAALLLLALALLAPPDLSAQREARQDDFLALTTCEAGAPITTFRSDLRDSLLLVEVEAHEAVHREQAAAHGSCDAFLATLTSARRVIDAELPAYCAQWKVVVARGADSAATK